MSAEYKTASFLWQRKQRYEKPKRFCRRKHDISRPEDRYWDGNFWQCVTCRDTAENRDETASTSTAPLTAAILALQEQIEREPLAWKKAELREKMRTLVSPKGGM